MGQPTRYPKVCLYCAADFQGRKEQAYCSTQHAAFGREGSLDPEVRFWSWVDVSGECWTWTGPVPSTGYPLFKVTAKGRIITVHRLSWEFTNGPIPNDKCVCHRCDNRRCVRPDHLFLGTQKDNMRDARDKGRLHAAKLTMTIAQQIREEYAAGGVTQKQLAERYHVLRTQISRIVNNQCWVA